MKPWLDLGSIVACVSLCFKIIRVLGDSCVVSVSSQSKENCKAMIMVVQDKTSWHALCVAEDTGRNDGTLSISGFTQIGS